MRLRFLVGLSCLAASVVPVQGKAGAGTPQEPEPTATAEAPNADSEAEDEPGVDPFPYQWVEITEGVIAALQPQANRFNDSNSVILVGEDDVVVVDTQNHPSTNRALIEKMRREIGKPVRFLVNTHWHGDHTQGNAVYLDAFPQLKIIGHPSLGEDIPGRAAPQLEEQMASYREAIPAAEKRLDEGVDRSGQALDAEGRRNLTDQIARARSLLTEMASVEFLSPTFPVTDRLLLERGEQIVDIRHFRAHTRGDLVVFLPREKILITGDLLDDLPYGGHGYPSEWVVALGELEKLDFEILIPGHGRLRQGKSHLRRVRTMFSDIVRAAEQAVEREASLAELQEALDLTPYREALAGDDPIALRAFDQFIPPAVERAWLEARGELPD